MNYIILITAAIVAFFSDISFPWLGAYLLLALITLLLLNSNKEQYPDKKDGETILEYLKRNRHEDALRSKRAVEDKARSEALKIVLEEETIELEQNLQLKYGKEAAECLNNIKNNVPWKGAYMEDILLALGEPSKKDGNNFIYLCNDKISSLYPIQYFVKFEEDKTGNYRAIDIQSRADFAFTAHNNSKISGELILKHLENNSIWLGATLDEVLLMKGKPDITHDNILLYKENDGIGALFDYVLRVTIDENNQVSSIRTLNDFISDKHPSLYPAAVLSNIENKRVFVDATREEVLYMLGKPEQIDSKGLWKYQKLGKRGSGYAWGLILKFNRGRVSEIRREQ